MEADYQGDGSAATEWLFVEALHDMQLITSLDERERSKRIRTDAGQCLPRAPARQSAPMIPALLDPVLWIGLLGGWAIFAGGQRLRARFASQAGKKIVNEADPPRGIDFADVREGLYLHGAPPDTPLHWAVALSALDCEREHFYHDRLDLLPPDAPQAARFMTRFASRHQIVTPGAWAARLRWLREGGHHRDIAVMRELMATLVSDRKTQDPASLENWLSAFSRTYGSLQSTRERQFRQLLEQPDRWQRMSGLAHDASHMVRYYRAGFRLGYIDEGEATRRIEEVAQAVAQHYTDWHSFETDLLLATAFVEGDMAGAQAAALRLRADAQAPWRVLSWPVVRRPNATTPGSNSIH
jgi:hypothetical protein